MIILNSKGDVVQKSIMLNEGSKYVFYYKEEKLKEVLITDKTFKLLKFAFSILIKKEEMKSEEFNKLYDVLNKRLYDSLDEEILCFVLFLAEKELKVDKRRVINIDSLYFKKSSLHLLYEFYRKYDVDNIDKEKYYQQMKKYILNNKNNILYFYKDSNAVDFFEYKLFKVLSFEFSHIVERENDYNILAVIFLHYLKFELAYSTPYSNLHLKDEVKINLLKTYVNLYKEKEIKEIMISRSGILRLMCFENEISIKNFYNWCVKENIENNHIAKMILIIMYDNNSAIINYESKFMLSYIYKFICDYINGSFTEEELKSFEIHDYNIETMIIKNLEFISLNIGDSLYGFMKNYINETSLDCQKKSFLKKFNKKDMNYVIYDYNLYNSIDESLVDEIINPIKFLKRVIVYYENFDFRINELVKILKIFMNKFNIAEEKIIKLLSNSRINEKLIAQIINECNIKLETFLYL